MAKKDSTLSKSAELGKREFIASRQESSGGR